MKIERFLSAAAAADGGSLWCQAELADGSVVDLGLDAGMPKKKSEHLVFMGVGYPTLSGVRILPRGCDEEREVVAAIQDYLERVYGSPAGESLLKADYTDLSDRESVDWMAASLLRAIADRGEP